MPTILVADDNSNIQKMVTLAFKNEGIDVVAVGNGEAAIRKAAEIMPDLVLADIFMPVRGGYEVCEFLKQDTRLMHVPVILLAGAFDPFDEKEAQRVGADGVLKKPFVPPEPLVNLVKSMLEKSQGARLVSVATVPVQAAAPAQAAPVAFTPPPARMESPVQTEIDEEPPLEKRPMADFSLSGTHVESSQEGGADAFGDLLGTQPENSAPSLVNAPTEQDMAVPPSRPAFDGVAAWADLSAPPEHAAPEPEQHDSIENAATLAPPATKPIGRAWEITSAPDAHSDEETIVDSLERFSSIVNAAPSQAPADADEGEETIPPVLDWRDALAKQESQQQADVSSGREDISLSPWHAPEPSAHHDASDDAGEVVNHELESNSPFSFASTAKMDLETPAEPIASQDSATEPASSLEMDVPAKIWQPPSPPATTSESVSNDFTAAPEHSSPASSELEATETHAAEPDPMSAWEIQQPSTEDSAPALDAHEQESVEEHAEHEMPLLDESALAEKVLTGLVPKSAEQMLAESFPVPTPSSVDPKIVEEIVVRVVERMRPQILDVITREVLRPVVEALVRRQIEQK